jgi:uncharacterized membrane protein (UPF0127 family)
MRKKAAIIIACFLALIGAFFLFRRFFGSHASKTVLEHLAEPQPVSVFTKRFIRLWNTILSVEIADSDTLRHQGLSGKDALKENQGMLFVFEKSDQHSFWMKNMNFPIDIIWFSESRAVVDTVENIPPEGNYPKIIYKPKEAAMYALEVSAGWAMNHSVVPGTQFSFCENELCNAAPATILPESDERAAVSFSPQAPFGEWSDDRQEDGCEEASIVMAHYWKQGKSLTREQVFAEIIALSAYEKKAYGYYNDTSAEDTAKLFRDYYKIDGVSARGDASVDSIKQELSAGNLVITPMNGQELHNPYYTAPGPPRHMILIIGYDDVKQEFITNDPGTRRGEGYRYPYDVFVNAIHDYPSGNKIPGVNGKRMMIVVEK